MRRLPLAAELESHHEAAAANALHGRVVADDATQPRDEALAALAYGREELGVSTVSRIFSCEATSHRVARVRRAVRNRSSTWSRTRARRGLCVRASPRPEGALRRALCLRRPRPARRRARAGTRTACPCAPCPSAPRPRMKRVPAFLPRTPDRREVSRGGHQQHLLGLDGLDQERRGTVTGEGALERAEIPKGTAWHSGRSG